MALKVALVATGILIGALGGAALGIHAQDEGDMGGADLTSVDGSSEVADTASAEPNSTVGNPAQQPFGVYDTLASCESSGDWHIQGRLFSGGLQFTDATWWAYGGGAYASRAGYATRDEQIDIAQRLHAARGWQPWPSCSRKLGLR